MSMNMTAEKNAPALDTSVTIAGVTLKNPVMTASGTFGSGAEYSEFVDLNKLGAVVTKGVANVLLPHTFTMIFVSNCFKYGISRLQNRSIPGF